MKVRTRRKPKRNTLDGKGGPKGRWTPPSTRSIETAHRASTGPANGVLSSEEDVNTLLDFFSPRAIAEGFETCDFSAQERVRTLVKMFKGDEGGKISERLAALALIDKTNVDALTAHGALSQITARGEISGPRGRLTVETSRASLKGVGDDTASILQEAWTQSHRPVDNDCALPAPDPDNGEPFDEEEDEIEAEAKDAAVDTCGDRTDTPASPRRSRRSSIDDAGDRSADRARRRRRNSSGGQQAARRMGGARKRLRRPKLRSAAADEDGGSGSECPPGRPEQSGSTGKKHKVRRRKRLRRRTGGSGSPVSGETTTGSAGSTDDREQRADVAGHVGGGNQSSNPRGAGANGDGQATPDSAPKSLFEVLARTGKVDFPFGRRPPKRIALGGGLCGDPSQGEGPRTDG